MPCFISQNITRTSKRGLQACLAKLARSSEQNNQQLSEADQQALHFFYIIIRAQLQGKSALPYQLGLTTADYKRLLTTLKSLEINTLDQQWHLPENRQQHNKSELMTNLLNLRIEERDALARLLHEHQSKRALFANLAAIIVATACLNPLHLWQSLGFEKRSDLGLWLALNFPDLSASNTKGMRWKRFFYLQLCEQGGDYVCRAPSCEECSSFAECFAPE